MKTSDGNEIAKMKGIKLKNNEEINTTNKTELFNSNNTFDSIKQKYLEAKDNPNKFLEFKQDTWVRTIDSIIIKEYDDKKLQLSSNSKRYKWVNDECYSIDFNFDMPEGKWGYEEKYKMIQTEVKKNNAILQQVKTIFPFMSPSKLVDTTDWNIFAIIDKEYDVKTYYKQDKKMTAIPVIQIKKNKSYSYYKLTDMGIDFIGGEVFPNETQKLMAAEFFRKD
jgi:hypothetical protein